MKRETSTNEQIADGQRQPEADTPTAEIKRKPGARKQTYDVRSTRLAGMGVAESRELRQLRKEEMKLQQLSADLSLDEHIILS